MANTIYTISVSEIIYYSENLGDTWVSIDGPFEDDNQFSEKDIFINDIGVLFALGDGSLFKSEDKDNWTEVEIGRELTTTVRDSHIDDNSIWISTSAENGQWILLYSTDSGVTWQVQDLDSFGAETISKNSQYVCYTSEAGLIYYSSDLGESWLSTPALAGFNRIVKADESGFLLSSEISSSIAHFNPTDLLHNSIEVTGITDYSFDGFEDWKDSLVVRSASRSSDFGLIRKSDSQFISIGGAPLSGSGSIATKEDQLYTIIKNEIHVYNDPSWSQAFFHPDDVDILRVTSDGNRLFANSINSNELLISEDNSDLLSKVSIDVPFVQPLSATVNDTVTIIDSTNEILISKRWRVNMVNSRP